MKETENGYVYEQELPKHLMSWQHCPQCASALAIVYEHGPEEDASLHCSNCDFRFYANPSPTVSMTLISADWKKVLLVKRAANPHAGRWALPGGFMDAGEDPQYTARRELMEEANTAASDKPLICLGAWPGLHVAALELTTVNIHYLGVHDGVTEPTPGSDALDVAWVEFDKVGELPFPNQRKAWEVAKTFINLQHNMIGF